MSYTLAIVGSRDYNKYEPFKELVDEYIRLNGMPSCIISGGADGIDYLAELYAERHNIPITIFDAEWSKYGKAAGPMRNTLIVKECDKLLAFPSKNSRGTFDTINKANALKKMVEVQYID